MGWQQVLCRLLCLSLRCHPLQFDLFYHHHPVHHIRFTSTPPSGRPTLHIRRRDRSLLEGFQTMQNISAWDQFEAAVKSAPKAVVHFWASWCEPCTLLDQILERLGQEHPQVACIRVEAEHAADISERCSVAVVPLFLFYTGGKETDRLEGADPVALTTKFTTLAGAGAASSGAQPAAAAAGAAGAAAPLQARLEALVRQHPVMLFMKGTPAEPRCGFSAKVVDALRAAGAADFGSFDILSDEAVRQGLKELSQWPTYPQVYVNGELLGGCDIVLELAQSGELQAEVAKAKAAAAPEVAASTAAAAAGGGGSGGGGAGSELKDRLESLLQSHEVMLFMKGTPAEPRCGFSSKVVGALEAINQPFGSFDILSDEAVRQGLKELSQWPTYPQLYVKGQLLGGCDIVLELAGAGELHEAIAELKE